MQPPRYANYPLITILKPILIKYRGETKQNYACLTYQNTNICKIKQFLLPLL